MRMSPRAEALPEIAVRREGDAAVARAEAALAADLQGVLTVTDRERLPGFVPGSRSARADTVRGRQQSRRGRL